VPEGGEELEGRERRHPVEVELPDRVEDQLSLSAEEVELGLLRRRFAGVLGEARTPADVKLLPLQVVEDLPRPLQNRLGDPREASHLNAVRAVRGALGHFPEEDDVAVPLLRRHRPVRDVLLTSASSVSS